MHKKEWEQRAAGGGAGGLHQHTLSEGPGTVLESCGEVTQPQASSGLQSWAVGPVLGRIPPPSGLTAGQRASQPRFCCFPL